MVNNDDQPLRDGRGYRVRSDRRRFLQATTGATLAGLAGCLGGGDGGDGNGGQTTDGGGPSDTHQNEAGNPVGNTADVIADLAQDEGSLTMYATIDREPMATLINTYQDEFGISVDHITGGNEELVARWRQEYDSGNVQADLMGTGSGFEQLIEHGSLVQLNADILPVYAELADSFKGENFTGFFQLVGGYQFNSDAVSQDDVSSWMSLVEDEMWADQNIGWDPTPNMFLMSWIHDTQGREYFEKLHDQRPRFVDSHTDLSRLNGAGEFPICHTYLHGITKFPELPVDFIRLDQLPASYNALAVNNKAANPNAALHFHNWLISEEGQNLMGEGVYIPVHPNATFQALPELTAQEGFEIIGVPPNKDVQSTVDMWKDVMGDLIGTG